jgi:ribosomal protein L37E
VSYGVAAYGTDGKLTFHSDYSSIVYYGTMSTTTSAVRPTYTGDHHIAISSSIKDSNYDMGWIIQYTITLDVDYMIPFYCPAYSGQEIAIMDIINEGTTWVVNVLFSGTQSQYPALYAFCPLTEIASSVSLNSYGIAVYDSSSALVFTDSKRPLRIDEVISITHPNSIKTGSKGTCGYSGASSTCHVSFTPDQSQTYSGSISNTANKLYHIVPSAYGGLAYNNNGTGSHSCGFLNLFTRNYSWAYKSWNSFRGTVAHPRGTTSHIAGWESDFSGAAYQYAEGGCGIGGFLGALIGVFLVVFTGGAALALIGGALAGFVVGDLSVGTAPSIKAYDADEVFDQNGRPVNLMVTDKTYYGIS